MRVACLRKVSEGDFLLRRVVSSLHHLTGFYLNLSLDTSYAGDM